MPTVFNGTPIDSIVFNGTVIDTAFFNGTEVSTPPSTMTCGSGTDNQSEAVIGFKLGSVFNPSVNGLLSPNPPPNLTTSGSGIPAVNFVDSILDVDFKVSGILVGTGRRVSFRTIGQLTGNADNMFTTLSVTGRFSDNPSLTQTKNLPITDLDGTLNTSVGNNIYIQTYQTNNSQFNTKFGFIATNQYEVKFLGRII
tara:strand:+ start:153 stop:743 length:591 start_codon:yes stop_codon:yes gene_type:complete